MEEASFNEFILANMPYFIAVNYQRLLDTQSPQKQVKLILHPGHNSLALPTVCALCAKKRRQLRRSKVAAPVLPAMLQSVIYPISKTTHGSEP
ncbi:MAG: hypothetical protein JO125_09510 [Chloroflexi bacterium]|nr:hypothetical protein [Ktedonobacteraceae bacterium]MBV9707630.1 hypothetical protein [Chloroflexota bacterium]